MQRLQRIAPPQVFVVLLMTALVSIVIFAISEMTSGRINQNRRDVQHVTQALEQLALVREGVLGAESAQRGYLLVGWENHLANFESSSTTAQNAISELASMTGDDLEFRARVEALREHVMAKLDELKLSVYTAREGNRERALAPLLSGSGLALMRSIERSANELEPMLEAESRRRTAALARSGCSSASGWGLWCC